MSDWNKFSYQEWFMGFGATILLTFKLGIIGISLAAVSGLLWMAGGTYLKAIRRYGVPLLVGSLSCFMLSSALPLVSVPLAIGILCIGDGYPSTQPYDSGSWLGQQVYKLGFNDEVGGFITKLVPVALLQLAWIPIFI